MVLPVEEIARRAREASRALAALDGAAKDEALAAVRDALRERRSAILERNRADRDEADRAVARGELSGPLAKRLDLSGDKYEALLAGVEDVIRLPDPVGTVVWGSLLDEGLELRRVTCPIGVLGVIFESRPE